MTTFELSALLFLQLAVILLTCRLVGRLAARFGQPAVVGEMIAGVLLGPSLFGWLAPGWHGALFPAESKPVLFCAAQVGLVLYMFIVGMEFRVDIVRDRLKSAAAISASGILAPFAFGCAIGAWLITEGGFFNEGVSPWQAMPYLGAAMSITAFPMLARIIVERGLAGTAVGSLSLAAGAIDDVAAWCVLAFVLAGFAGDPLIALRAIGGCALLVVVLLTFGRRLLRTLALRGGRSADDGRRMLGWVLVLLMACAWFTDAVGIYAVFGAFALGTAMPRGEFADSVRRRVEPLSSQLLLPLFFIYSGLNTRFDLARGAGVWLVAGVVIVAAMLGKAGACYLAARACGESRRDALGVGALMNARGLMELIILNIGLERGLITPAFFTVMVLMALVTTLVATPMFNRIQRGRTSCENASPIAAVGALKDEPPHPSPP